MRISDPNEAKAANEFVAVGSYGYEAAVSHDRGPSRGGI